MERSVVRVVIILTVLVVQTSFFSALFAEGTVPLFPLVVVIAWTLLLGFMESWKWAVITGIACDAVFAMPMGTMVAILTVSSYGISFRKSFSCLHSRYFGKSFSPSFFFG